jgi:hypothetical protein
MSAVASHSSPNALEDKSNLRAQRLASFEATDKFSHTGHFWNKKPVCPDEVAVLQSPLGRRLCSGGLKLRRSFISGAVFRRTLCAIRHSKIGALAPDKAPDPGT